MKAKKMLALVVAMIMVMAIANVALAVGSPSGSTTPTPVNLETPSSSAVAAMTDAADNYVTQKYGSDYVAETLASYDISLQSGASSGTITLNVAGVRAGDIILVIHQKADGSIEIIPATVLANGVISFYMGSFSPISIVRVAQAGAASADTMYKTGDTTSAATMVLLIAACGAALFACGKALRKAN